MWNILNLQVGREEIILREWLDCVVTKGGCLVALQKLGNHPPAVKQMLEEWLDHYRHIIHPRVSSGSQSALATQTFSSDGESDQEWMEIYLVWNSPDIISHLSRFLIINIYFWVIFCDKFVIEYSGIWYPAVLEILCSGILYIIYSKILNYCFIKYMLILRQ